MKLWQQIGVISGISFAAAFGTFLVKGPPSRLLRCDPSALQSDELCLDAVPADAEVLWVDARSRADWEKSGVHGSVLWNLDATEDMRAFEAEIAGRIMMTPRVIVYCGDENCGVSRQVAERIRALDLGAEVFVLHGGWRALNEAGRVKGSSPKS